MGSSIKDKDLDAFRLLDINGPIIIEHFIDNQFVNLNGETMDLVNPSNSKILGVLPLGGSQEIEIAVTSSKKAFKEWSQTSRSQRSYYLDKIADAIESPKWFDKLALAESLNSGKTFDYCKAVDIPRAVHNFRYFSKMLGSWHPDSVVIADNPNAKALNYSKRKPIGIAGLISPWNLPLYLLTWKIAPCIAVGSVCICKPSEVTPLTAYYLCQIIEEVGLPKGVINIVFGLGKEAGQSLIEHPSVKAISFTGGTSTGKIVSRICAENFKKVSLELGGKNPSIILPDCNLEEAIDFSARAAFSNQGQICLCMSRIYVHETLYEEFVEGLVRVTEERYKIGIPWKSGTSIGALSSRSHFEKVRSYLRIAKEEGGTIKYGGQINNFDHLSTSEQAQIQGGHFISPTIIVGLNPYTSRVINEEIFGPIVTVTPYSTIDQAIELANNTKYGLAACVWGSDIKQTRKVAESVEAGMVWVNCWMYRDTNTPFGGIKDSGVGREGGNYSLSFFTEVTNITLAD